MAENKQQGGLFGLGDKNTAYQKYFIGQSYLNSLIPADDNIDVHVANVTFEPGCRNNWHIHHAVTSCCWLLLVRAGIKKRASRPDCYIPATPSPFTRALSTGMAPRKTAGSATLPLPKAPLNGWPRSQMPSTPN